MSDNRYTWQSMVKNSAQHIYDIFIYNIYVCLYSSGCAAIHIQSRYKCYADIAMYNIMPKYTLDPVHSTFVCLHDNFVYVLSGYHSGKQVMYMYTS